MTFDVFVVQPQANPDGTILGSYLPIIYTNTDNAVSPCVCYQRILDARTEDVLIYCHSDLTIYEKDWTDRIMALFDNPKCVAAGLGGAVGLGTPDLYRKPYTINNMARIGYVSNQTDAEVHGGRLDGTKRVAVLDAFVLAVRAAWLRSRGGWPVGHLTHHCLDTWLACEAARCGKETWIAGVSCTHHGGGTSTKETYAKATWLQGGTRDLDHTLPHKWLFNEYRDVLPIHWISNLQ
jgi:hypothetical protein